jgi:hypothetical protein
MQAHQDSLLFSPTIFGFPTGWCHWNKECSSFIYILDDISLNNWMKMVKWMFWLAGSV